MAVMNRNSRRGCPYPTFTATLPELLLLTGDGRGWPAGGRGATGYGFGGGGFTGDPGRGGGGRTGGLGGGRTGGLGGGRTGGLGGGRRGISQTAFPRASHLPL